MAAAASGGKTHDKIPKYHFVISAHGIAFATKPPFEIPENTSIHTVPIGHVLACEKKTQTEVCNSAAGEFVKLPWHWNGAPTGKARVKENYIDFNIYFMSDPHKKFKSGLIQCGSKEPIYDIDKSGSTTLHDLAKTAYYHVKSRHPDDNFRIHISVLTCLELLTGPTGITSLIKPTTSSKKYYGGPSTGGGASGGGGSSAAASSASSGSSGAWGIYGTGKKTRRDNKKHRKMRRQTRRRR